jgi:natural product precursor
MKNMKLNALENQSLNNKEMNKVRGGGQGDPCCCGCNYAGTPGGSSTSANDNANTAGGLHSPGCETKSDCDSSTVTPPVTA